MAIASTTALVDALRQRRLLEAAQLEEVARTLQARFPDPKSFARELIQRGWLTPYQANQLLQGKGQELVLGSYILLEKLGEGGMGQVFKARHRNLGRIVALKLIRKERLAHPDAVRLSPLKSMPLTSLHCYATPVADLSPLKGMKLTALHCYATPVADLSPLKGMPLTSLNCGGTKVADLLPLKGMPLTDLHCGSTKVSDLSPLKHMPLKELHCDFRPDRDVEILHSIKTLEKINDKAAKEFWKEVEAKEKEKKP